MMPTCYFTLHGEGIELPDLAGRSLRDDSQARAKAERLAAEPAGSALNDEQMRPVPALPLNLMEG